MNEEATPTYHRECEAGQRWIRDTYALGQQVQKSMQDAIKEKRTLTQQETADLFDYHLRQAVIEAVGVRYLNKDRNL